MSEQETVVLDIHTEAKPRRVRDVAARMLALSRNDVPDKTEADALLVRLVEILAVYREHSREPGLEPHFVSPDRLAGLDLHPVVAGHLLRLLDPGPHGYAPYVGNLWRQPAVPGLSPNA